MTSFFSLRKSIVALLVLALVAVSNINAGTFTDIDITKTDGNKDAIKAAAAKVCGADLSADELTRRGGLARTAISDFLNPRIIEALKTNNNATEKALKCQKIRTEVLTNTCDLQASIKKSLKCETDKFTKKLAQISKAAPKFCKGVDAKLFVTVIGINEPKPPQNPVEPCGVSKPKQVFTSKFADVDITKAPGTGVEAKSAAEKVCGANLSEGELNHRGKLGSNVNKKFFNAQIKTASGNVPLQNALNCQKARNSIMINTCFLQSSTKANKAFNAQVNTIQQQRSIDLANKVCANIDPKLLVTVPEIISTKRKGSSKKKPSSKVKPNSISAAAGHNNNFVPSSVVFLSFVFYLLL